MGIVKKTIIALLASALVNPVQISWPDTKINPKISIEDILNSRIDNNYDDDTFLVDYEKMSFARILDSVYKIDAVLFLKYTFNDMNYALQGRSSGTAFVISESQILNWALEKSDKYNYNKKTLEERLSEIKVHGNERQFLYTVAHVISVNKVDDDILSQKGIPKSATLIKAEIDPYITYNNKRIKLKKIFSNQGLDVALLEPLENIKLPVFPYKIGDSDKLKVPNFLYVIGNSNDLGIDVGTGNVSKSYSPIVSQSQNKSDFFSIKYGLNVGDSGGPIIAIMDGNYELVGINEALVLEAQMMGLGVKINPQMNLIVKELYFKK